MLMYLFLIGLLGLCIGSFLNVLISRLPEGKTLWGRSMCVHCSTQLTWWQLVPGVSFLLLRGKCYACKKSISWQYPLVELLTAGMFALIGWYHGMVDATNWLLITRDLFAVSALITIGMIDALYYLILNRVLLVVGSVLLVLDGFLVHWDVSRLLDYGLAALIGFLFFWVQYALSKGRWVGGGDMKLAAVLGLLLGFQGLLVALLLSYVGGAIISVFLMAFKKKGMKSEMPMGTFLALASVVALLFGEKIASWYVGML